MTAGNGVARGLGRLYGTVTGAPQRRASEPPPTVQPSPNGDIPRGGPPRGIGPLVPGEGHRLPPGMAELHVYQKEPTADGRQRFGLRAMCCCTEVQELGVYGRPRLDLGTLVSPEGRLPSDVIDSVASWSIDQSELTAWLDGRRHDHAAKLELVIWDDTGFRIPWELFWLGAEVDSGRTPGPLGALVTVTRWLTMRTAWTDLLKHFFVTAPYQGSGPVAAFIDPDMKHDASLLEKFQVERAASMGHVFADLNKVDEDGLARALALVYVACHGEFGDRPEDCRLAGFPLNRASRLADGGLRRLKAWATLVFLNACSSGSIGIDTGMYNDGALRGFAEVFLRAGAAGVLATTGAVGDDLARTVAGDLFAHLELNPGLPVAEAVRQLREQAAKLIAAELNQTGLSEAERQAADLRLLPLVYRFMYVYYGSPRLLLSLVRGTGLPGPEEVQAAGEPT